MKLWRSVLCILSMLLMSVSLGATWNGSAGATTSPKKLTGHLLTRTNNSVAFGSLLTHSVLNGGSISGKVLLGKYGYALATVGIYQYPVATDDHGKQWRIAGDYFNMVSTSGMGAGGTATNVAVLSRAIAVAYRDGDISDPTSNIYVTVDSGRRWYVTALPGTVQGVGVALGGPNHSALTAIFETVRVSSPSAEKLRYESLDDGRNWSLK